MEVWQGLKRGLFFGTVAARLEFVPRLQDIDGLIWYGGVCWVLCRGSAVASFGDWDGGGALGRGFGAGSFEWGMSPDLGWVATVLPTRTMKLKRISEATIQNRHGRRREQDCEAEEG